MAVKEVNLDSLGGSRANVNNKPEHERSSESNESMTTASDYFDGLRAEITTLTTCEHPNIVRYHRSYVPSHGLLWIVMEYCGGGSLRQILDKHGPLPEPIVVEITASLLCALSYLHKQNIAHRDLKAANVFVDDAGHIKVGDFGVAAATGGSLNYNLLAGSPYWMAPEVISPKVKSYDVCRADIWSLGITLIELLKGRPPLSYLSPSTAMLTIPVTTPPRIESTDQSVSERLRALIHSCLHDDPLKRPTADYLLKTSKNFFLRNGGGHLLQFLQAKTDFAAQNGGMESVKSPILSPKASEALNTIISQWDFDLLDLDGLEVEDDEYEEEERGFEGESGESLGSIETMKTLEPLEQSLSSITVSETIEVAAAPTSATTPNDCNRKSLAQRGNASIPSAETLKSRYFELKAQCQGKIIEGFIKK